MAPGMTAKPNCSTKAGAGAGTECGWEKSAALANGAAMEIEENFLWNHVLRSVQVMHENAIARPLRLRGEECLHE